MLNGVQLLATPRTAAYQVPLSMGFYPGKSTGMGCHFLLQVVALSHVVTINLEIEINYYIWAINQCHMIKP